MMKICLVLIALVSSNALLAETAAFPQTEKSWRQTPATMVPQAINRVALGLRKREVYQILGAPHFGEGIGARRWNYWFLGAAKQNCMMQIHYDQKMKVETIAWNSPSCAVAS